MDCFRLLLSCRSAELCGTAELWGASGLPEKRCAHPYCIPALCACTILYFKSLAAFSSACISIVFQHWLRAFPLHREAFWITLDRLWAVQRSGKFSGLL